jgi:hypothetical protein
MLRFLCIGSVLHLAIADGPRCVFRWAGVDAIGSVFSSVSRLSRQEFRAYRDHECISLFIAGVGLLTVF